jgi:tRNA(fMet)-specific endonuclease VapC
VKKVLVDTDILSMFFRDNTNVKFHFSEYLKQHKKINISIITYYEILSGLKHKDAKKQLNKFVEFTTKNIVLPLTVDSVTISSEIYANLRRGGEVIDDIDILIAGIALSNNMVLVTHNENHFKRIERLLVDDWSRSPKKNEE